LGNICSVKQAASYNRTTIKIGIPPFTLRNLTLLVN
jgi:hypothetical protein